MSDEKQCCKVPVCECASGVCSGPDGHRGDCCADWARYVKERISG